MAASDPRNRRAAAPAGTAPAALSAPVLDLFREVERLKTGGQTEQAIALYRAWLTGAASPLAYAVWFNLGVELGNLKRHDEALAAYRQALALKADFLPARFNLGTQLEQTGQPREALAAWRAILDQYPEALAAEPAMRILALNNLGRLLEVERDYPEAEAMLARSLALDPAQPKVIQHWFHLRQKQCAWPLDAGLEGIPPDAIAAAASALSTLALTDDPERQRAVAQRFADERIDSALAPLANPEGYGHERLRIGYLSSDFCQHPVALLTAELFELHDRRRFSVHGFCWTREDGSPIRRRIVTAMDKFTRIGQLDDAAAAQCIRDQEIDILVDLQGLTSGARPNILSRRPAPVQIAYLGFPGTTGHPAIDYAVADDHVLPPEAEAHFSERPLRLPDCFHVCDRRRELMPPQTRAARGLPEDAFVFCCLNNTYKITPEIFAAWMRILRRVPESLLWLLADNPQVPLNLRREAEAQGIAPERLHFVERVPPGVYLASYPLADLFLDTFPFNAGTTANDALWMGLPLLTLGGRSFASRMAGSLLRAVGLPELIAANLQDYETLAVALARDPERLGGYRRALAERRADSPLFDMPRRVRDLETLYLQAYAAALSGDDPSADRTEPGVRRFLHVGCGPNRKEQTLASFNTPRWEEVRYDIDPAAEPDILGTMTDMSSVADASMDAIYSSHTIEHLHSHEVPIALKEFLRVLKPDGFVAIVCPDLQSVCALVADNKLTEPAYQSPAGPIAPLDIIYGHQKAIAAGNGFMAHRCGFTRDTLRAAFAAAGFGSVSVVARPEHFDLWAFATKRQLTDAAFAALSYAILAPPPPS